jgi:molybdopterin converting factor small subunit
MATVYLPAHWTAATGGISELVVDAPRVADLMRVLVERFPALASQLDTIAVAVDGEIYLDADYIDIGEHTEVHLVPRVSGGAC